MNDSLVQNGDKDYFFRACPLSSYICRENTRPSFTGMTAAGLYRHFADKEAMFEELVAPAVKGLNDIFLAVQRDFDQLPPDIKRETAFDYSTEGLRHFVAFIYEHFDQFKLLVTCAGGTAYADFINLRQFFAAGWRAILGMRYEP